MKLATLLTVTFLSVLNSYAQPGDYHRFRLYLDSTTRDSMFFGDFVNSNMLDKSYDSALVVEDTMEYTLLYTMFGGYSSYRGIYQMTQTGVKAHKGDSIAVRVIPRVKGDSSLAKTAFVSGGTIAERHQLKNATPAFYFGSYSNSVPMQYYDVPHLLYPDTEVPSIMTLNSRVAGSFGQGQYLFVAKFSPMQFGGETDSGFYSAQILMRKND